MSGTYQGKTGEQWREMSRKSSQASQDSFDRSDTDGFLSQWASDTVARQYSLCAELADANSQWEFVAVFTTDGKHVDARKVDTKYGWSWLIRNEDGTVAWFNPSEARNGERRLKADTKKGYLLGVVRTEGRVVSVGSDRLHVSYRVIPVDGADVEIVDNGSDLTEYQDQD